MATGDIVIRLQGQNQLSGPINQSRGSLQNLDSTMQRHRGSILTNQSAISNLSFAIEDAAVSYGTTGLAGAIRGASNNLTMIAAAFGPHALLIASATSAVTQLGLAWSKTGSQATEAAEQQRRALEEQKRSLDEMNAERRRQIGNIRQRPGDIGLTEPGAMKARLEEVRRERGDIQSEMEILTRDIDTLGRRRREVFGQMTNQGDISLEEFTNPKSGTALAGLRDQLKAIDDELKTLFERDFELREDVGGLTAEQGRLQGRLPEERNRIEQERLRQQFEQDRQAQLERNQITPAQFGPALVDQGAARELRRQQQERLALAGSLAFSDFERRQRESLEFDRRRFNPNLSQQQTQFLAGQALGGTFTSKEAKRDSLIEQMEKHLAEINRRDEREERQSRATTAEEFAIATFP